MQRACARKVISSLSSFTVFHGQKSSGGDYYMNPIKRIRPEKRLTAAQLAVLAGVSASRVWQLERGENARLTGPVLAAVARLGYDPKQVAREYKQWREQQMAKVMELAGDNDGVA